MTARIVSYRPRHFEGVEALWETCFPNNPPHNQAAAAIPAKLAVGDDLFIVAEDEGIVVGTILAGYDGHRGWLYAVAVRASHRRTGLGVALIEEAERRLAALGCGKINLQVRIDNDAVTTFYRSLGYEVEPRISMGKLIVPAR